MSEIQPHNQQLACIVPAQGSLPTVLSPVLCISASTAQKDVRNLHLTPWFQHRLPEPRHLRKYSSALRQCRAGQTHQPWGREQQFPALLWSVRCPPGMSPAFGDSTDKPCPLTPAACRAGSAIGTDRERSEGHSPPLPAPLSLPDAASWASPLTSSTAGVTVGSVCSVPAPHCALQLPLPSLLLFLSVSLSLPLPRLKWIMRSLITKTWQLFPRLKPSMKCSVLTSFPTSPITDIHRMRRWRDIAMGRY